MLILDRSRNNLSASDVMNGEFVPLQLVGNTRK
jgi:hypothetical protein